MILMTRNGMGNADHELGQKLIGTYLRLLLENSFLAAIICLFTEGVKLAVEGSPVIEQLQALEEKKYA